MTKSFSTPSHQPRQRDGAADQELPYEDSPLCQEELDREMREALTGDPAIPMTEEEEILAELQAAERQGVEGFESEDDRIC